MIAVTEKCKTNGCHRSAYSQTCASAFGERFAQVSEYRDLWHPCELADEETT